MCSSVYVYICIHKMQAYVLWLQYQRIRPPPRSSSVCIGSGSKWFHLVTTVASHTAPSNRTNSIAMSISFIVVIGVSIECIPHAIYDALGEVSIVLAYLVLKKRAGLSIATREGLVRQFSCRQYLMSSRTSVFREKAVERALQIYLLRHYGHVQTLVWIDGASNSLAKDSFDGLAFHCKNSSCATLLRSAESQPS